MLSTADIKKDLASNGYKWLPNYKSILTDVWAHAEMFFDEDESVQSALWCSFKRENVDFIGVIFITTKRCFTVECVENQSQVKYTPIQVYNLEKIQVQFAETNGKLNYVSLVSDSFGNGTTFACPNKDVVNHFIETLKGKTNGTIEFLPDSDDPLLAENEKEQLIDEDLNKAKEAPPQKKPPKIEEIKPIEEFDGWRKETTIAEEKEVVIKKVNKKKEKKVDPKGYGSNFQSKLWLLWLLLPLVLIGIVLGLIYLL